MSILSTREWETLILGLLFLVYIMCHKEIRKSFWKVIVIFFDKKLRILWEIILLSGKRQIMRQSLNSTPPVMGGAASGIRPEDYLTMA